MGVQIPRAMRYLGVGATVAGGLVLFKEFVGGSNYSGTESLEGKTVIVTGANTGIGRETALELARRKARVVMACRSLEKCKQVRKDIITETLNRSVVCRECDLASFDSVRKFAEEINKNESKVSLLINNAGVMRCPRTLSPEGIELQFATNHLGHFLLTHLLLDKIKASPGARIVTVSSVAHHRGSINFPDLNSEKEYDASKAYNQSKLANVLFTKKLARELKDSDIITSVVHPGLVNTEIGRHMSVANSWVAMVLLRPFLWLCLKTPRQGAQTTIYAALSPDANTSGAYYSNQELVDASFASRDEGLQDLFWRLSLQWCRLRPS